MKTILSLLAGAAMACGAPPLLAAPADRPAPELEAAPSGYPVIPLLHARWLARDGAPPNIRYMAQTPDGWLWLASSAGLYRFDGQF